MRELKNVCDICGTSETLLLGEESCCIIARARTAEGVVEFDICPPCLKDHGRHTPTQVPGGGAPTTGMVIDLDFDTNLTATDVANRLNDLDFIKGVRVVTVGA